MNLRFFTAAVVLLAGYIAFADTIHASWTMAPETLISDIGRGIGSAISGAARALTTFVGF